MPSANFYGVSQESARVVTCDFGDAGGGGKEFLSNTTDTTVLILPGAFFAAPSLQYTGWTQWEMVGEYSQTANTVITLGLNIDGALSGTAMTITPTGSTGGSNGVLLLSVKMITLGHRNAETWGHQHLFRCTMTVVNSNGGLNIETVHNRIVTLDSRVDHDVAFRLNKDATAASVLYMRSFNGVQFCQRSGC
jgi:hypothetical protein